MAALTAAFELSATQDLRDQFDITVFQSGHRLGGKGASGRNQKRFERIEEHGLHLFYGFYDNAFSMMRRCYEELNRPLDAPLATLEDAFKPHDLIVFEEHHQGSWQHQPLFFPRNSDPPGLGRPIPTPAELIPMMLEFLLDLFERQQADSPSFTGSTLEPLRSALVSILGDIGKKLAAPEQGLVALRREEVLRRVLAASSQLWDLCKKQLARKPEKRAAWNAVDITLAMIRGMIVDGLVREENVNWLRLDHEDFRAWLSRHGASPSSVRASTVTGVYAGAYSADIEIGAGTALHWTLRMLYTYRGSIFYKMQAGMGDVVFAPLYEVLRRRGVHFRFFHRVDALRLSNDRRRIASIEIGRQIEVRGGRDYEPLHDVAGLPCWPTEPLYDQLVDGERLCESGENLEDWGCRFPDALPRLVLEDGRDFDHVILGVGLGLLPAICKDLLDDIHNPRFAAMVRKIPTTMTASAQLWKRDDLQATGWHLPPPVMIPYAQPLDTWADMSHLLPRERFPVEDHPRSIAYLTSSMPDEERAPITRDEYVGYSEKQRRRVHALTAQHLDNSAAHLWPKICRSDGALDRRRLYASGGNADPLDEQHMSPLLSPSDRYVLSPRGTTQFRLSADESGYRNLVLCGDWTLNPMNLGCVEAATMSGIRAAQVLSGRPITLHDDWLAGNRRSPKPTELPRYIERQTNESTSPPYIARDSTMITAWLRANPQKLRALCDRHLGFVETHAYVPLGGLVIFYAQDNQRISAVDAPGSIHERDYGFMVPLVLCDRRRGRLEPRGIGVYVPYLWVDVGAAVYGGREVLGFPKGQGELSFESSRLGGVSLSLDTWLPPATGGPEVSWQKERVLEVHAGQSAAIASAPSLADLMRSLRDLSGLEATGIDRAKHNPLLRAFVATVRSGAPRMVFLKQYRDAERRDRACYQAIVEAPCRILGTPRAQQLLRGPIELRVSSRLGVVDELGLAYEANGEMARVTALLGTRTELDFAIDKGLVMGAST